MKSWKHKPIRVALSTLFILTVLTMRAQEVEFYPDTVFLQMASDSTVFQQISDLDPNRAAILSAILPGLGQAYNGQPWKMPFVFAGAMALGHYLRYNNEMYHAFRNALIAETDGRDDTINPYASVGYTSESLRRQQDLFRRNRDFLVIIGSVFYLVNIAEAYIAAHLKEFELNETLSLNMGPSFQQGPLFSRTVGVSVRLNF